MNAEDPTRIKEPHNNPSTFDIDSPTNSVQCVKKEIIVSAVANLSTAYNLSVIDYGLLFMERSYGQPSEKVISLVSACSIVGAIFGQLSFGYIGDALGRKKGMILTLLFTIMGSVASAFLPWGQTSRYHILALCRFILGVGVGGVYPLSATTAIESTSDSHMQDIRVATVFSFQGWGQLFSPLIAFILTQCTKQENISWRILLGIGALPGIFVLKHALNAKESQAFQRSQRLHDRDSLKTVLFEQGYGWYLVGTSLSWFLFDITFYGNIIFTPSILEHVYNINVKHLSDVTKYSILVAAIALPGYYISILVIGKMSYRTVQLQGFLMVSFIFLILGVFYETLKQHSTILFILYSMTFFFSNFGPNVSTFSLPAEIFPVHVRVELNGISAAFGKLGAVIGASCFHPIEEQYGLNYVLIICSIISFFGFLITFLFFKNNIRQEQNRLEEIRHQIPNNSLNLC